MADALNPVGTIYQGFWINWSQGGVWGHTLTLNATAAAVFSNVLAIWVTLCGIQLWTIVRYAVHRRGVSFRPEPPTPHLNKEQVILRNATSAFATARLMFQLAFTDRKSTGRRSVRAFAIAFSATIYIVLFILAELFSNQAISAPTYNSASAVLLTNDTCGIWSETYERVVAEGDYTNATELAMYFEDSAQAFSDVQLSLEYAQECYKVDTSSSDKSSTCYVLKTPTIDWKTLTNASCAFEAQLCHENSDTMILDTGDIHSLNDLGINASPDDQMTYRRITTCTVLNDTSHSAGWDGMVVNASSPRPASESAYVFYGPSISRSTNWTYSYANFASFYNNFSNIVTTPYQLDVAQALAPASPQWTPNDFDPIPGLVLESADLNLIFLSFTGLYLGEVQDPWFSSHKLLHFDNPLPLLQDRYARDSAISTMACTEQHNFCTHQGQCTGFLGFDQVQNVNGFNSALTPNQNATFDRILRGVVASRLSYVLPYLSHTTTPILANSLTFGGKSGATVSESLPNGQWKTELQFWHSIAMAQLQRTVARWATGQIAAQPNFLQPASTPQDKWFCKSMITYSTTYSSFNVMSIILILAIGTLIIAAGLFIEPLARFTRKCRRKSGSDKSWNHDAILELKRQATDPEDNESFHSDLRLSRLFKPIDTTNSDDCSGHVSFGSEKQLPPTPAYDGVRSSAISHHSKILDSVLSQDECWMTISLRSPRIRPPHKHDNITHDREPDPRHGSSISSHDYIDAPPSYVHGEPVLSRQKASTWI